jgi:hypothetical protein
VTINGKPSDLTINTVATAPALVAGTKMFPGDQNKEVQSSSYLSKKDREWHQFQLDGSVGLKKSQQRLFYSRKMDISQAKFFQVKSHNFPH